jgi:hypothetical protein
MLVPQHPQPVARRRAVPEVSVAWTQPAAITTGHVLGVAPEPGESLPRQAGVEPETPICVSVVYRLGEYMAVLRESLPSRVIAYEQARGRLGDGRLKWSSRLALAVLLPLIGPPVFWRKKRCMPVCRFTIDATGLVRETRAGTLRIDWQDVVAVHRLAGAWLVDKGRGALPLPYRCFSEPQRAAFERLLLSRFGDDTPV